jgi:hypothetical protein
MAIGKFLSPKNDLAFKRIFGTEKNKFIVEMQVAPEEEISIL